eukprot:8099362-Prorocentrum_lima.AAC.1
MAAHHVCAGGECCSSAHGWTAQRCRCDTTGVTDTSWMCSASKQSLHAHALPSHVGDDDGRRGKCHWREGPRHSACAGL